MLDVMLIDDDKLIRDYLHGVIEWEKLDLNLVCEASDGIAAWDLYCQFQPQILIIDINIPFLNGIDFAKKVMEQNPKARIIVITGYTDFENVRQSLSVGAIDILSKPIIPEQINKSLQKATEEFNKLRQEYHTKHILENLINTNLVLLQECYISQLVEKDFEENDDDRLYHQASLLSLNFPAPYYAVVLIQLKPYSTEKIDDAVFLAAFKNLCSTTFSSNGFQVYNYYSNSNLLSCVLNWDVNNSIEQIEAILLKLLEETRIFFRADFSASIGSQVNRLCDLHLSFQLAQLTTNYYDDDNQGIASYNNISKVTPLTPPHDKVLVSKIIESIQHFRYTEVKALLDTAGKQSNMNSFRELAFDILSQTGAICYQAGLYPWTTVNYPKTISLILNASTVLDIENVLLTACSQLMDLLYKQRIQSKNQLIQKAKSYIKENLHDPDLSLSSVSTYVGLSKNYFCQLFVKEDHVSFNAYLNNERIALAKDLLRFSDKKVSEIAVDVGYNSPKYFNYIFKKIVKETPLEYRNNKSKRT